MHVQLLNLCGGYEEYHTSHIFELGMFGEKVVMGCSLHHSSWCVGTFSFAVLKVTHRTQLSSS